MRGAGFGLLGDLVIGIIGASSADSSSANWELAPGAWSEA